MEVHRIVREQTAQGLPIGHFIMDSIFKNEKDAMAHAMAQNLKYTNALALWNGSMQDISDFMHVFTTDDRYLNDREYFVFKSTTVVA